MDFGEVDGELLDFYRFAERQAKRAERAGEGARVVPEDPVRRLVL
ncbi:hypothetical protein [Nocardia asteroides]|nr:hypothetical protein [Nocardia asteroides]